MNRRLKYFLTVILILTLAMLSACAGNSGNSSGDSSSAGFKTAVCEESGYSLEYGSKYDAEITGNSITVYTGGEKDIPYYFVAPMQITDKTAREYAEYDYNNILEYYRSSLKEEPKAVELDFGSRKAFGTEYSFLSDDGTKTYTSFHYIVPCGKEDSYMSWTSIFEETDRNTPDDMHHAMETFRLTED